MIRTTLIVAATAIPAFGAGMWTHTLLPEYHRAEAGTVSFLRMISPLEMHRTLKHHNLPVQHMQGDFN